MAFPKRSLAALALLGLASGRRLQAGTSPVEKVITLLEGLKTKVETQGETESGSYETFCCFCKDTTKTKEEAITTGQDDIDKLNADIEDDTATKETKATELAERKKAQEEHAIELADTQARCLAEMAEFEATVADLSKAVKSLTKAVTALSDSKPALLEVRRTVKEGMALAEAAGMATAAQKQKVQAFLKVDPSDPGYKFHSDEIVTTLENLQKDFEDKKKDSEDEWEKAKDSCDKLKKDLTDQMDTNKDSMDTLETDMDTLKTTIAGNKESLVEAESLLADDQAYLKDLTQQCEAKAKVWDQRSKMRADELEAIEAALTILKDGGEGGKSIKELDEVNKRALAQVKSVPQAKKALAKALITKANTTRTRAPSLLQEASEKAAPHRPGLRGQAFIESSAGMRQAVELLKKEGKRLGSGLLAAVSVNVASGGPLDKVKDLIQKLIERLLTEAAEEATKKGFCDTEVGKAKKDRDFRRDDTKKLSAEITTLEATRDELDDEIEKMNESVDELKEALNETGELRKEEHKENIKSIKTAREGVVAVKEAIETLKLFYARASAGKVLLQTGENPEAPDAGFKGAYKGQQDGAKGVIATLEVIQSDFERTARKTDEAEKEAQTEYVDFEQTSKMDIGGKEMTIELSSEELKSTKTAIEEKMKDLETAQELLDAALKTIEDLKPMCIDTDMSWEERKAKREEEIDALKKALCHLDPDKVEPECA